MKAHIKKQWLAPLFLAFLVAALALLGVQTILAQGNADPPAVASPSGPAAPDVAMIQIAHLAPFDMDPGTAVTVALDGMTVLTNVTYAQSTGYLSVPPGPHLVQIFPGSSSTPAISETVLLTDTLHFTAIAVGGTNTWPLELKLLVDDTIAPPPGLTKVRIGHLAPFAANMAGTLADVRNQNGTLVPGFDDVPYDTIAPYVALAAGTYDLKITSADGTVVLIDPVPVTFAGGDIVSVFAVGDGVNQPLGIYALPSGNPGALVPLAPRLQLAHLAPFAMDPGTAVTVTLDSTPVVTDFEFAESTGYIWGPLGSHTVGVFAGSSATPAITATVVLTQDTDYTVLAIGNIANQALALRLLEDDNTPPMPGLASVRIGHLAPFASAPLATLADVRLQDGTLLATVPYNTIGSHIPFTATTYDLKVTAPTGFPTLIDPMPVALADGAILSVFAVGDGVNQPFGVFALPSGSPGGLVDLAANVQLAHLAPFAMGAGTAVTVTVNGTAVLTDVRYADSTGYLPVKAGSTLVEIYPGASATPAITAAGYFSHAMHYTAIAVGDGVNQLLGLQVLMDDLTPPTTGAGKVRLGHLAPFTSTLMATLADVRLQDGTPLATNVPYGTVAPTYSPLPAMGYDLKITAPGGTPTLIDPFPIALMDGDILSVFAVGNGTNQPLGVFALPAGAPGRLLPVVRTRIHMPIIFKDTP